jgi:hypothetical protein
LELAVSTVDKAFADKVVAAKGHLYPDDPFEPPITRIVEYTNAWGGQAFGMTFRGQDPDKYMRPTEFVNNPRIYWEQS